MFFLISTFGSCDLFTYLDIFFFEVLRHQCQEQPQTSICYAGLPGDLQKPLSRTRVLSGTFRNIELSKPKVITKIVVFTLLCSDNNLRVPNFSFLTVNMQQMKVHIFIWHLAPENGDFYKNTVSGQVLIPQKLYDSGCTRLPLSIPLVDRKVTKKENSLG